MLERCPEKLLIHCKIWIHDNVETNLVKLIQLGRISSHISFSIMPYVSFTDAKQDCNLKIFFNCVVYIGY